MYIMKRMQMDVEWEESAEVCMGCGGSIKEGNVAWFLDDDGDSYLPCHADGDCVDEDRMITQDQYEEIRDTTLAPVLDEEACEHHCMGVDLCSICGPDDADVGYDVDGRPIGG
jgi:hypothetical protein